jgi:hypothetical protein
VASLAFEVRLPGCQSVEKSRPSPCRTHSGVTGPYFTLFLPGALVEIILTYIDAWQANRERLLMALRLCEGSL